MHHHSRVAVNRGIKSADEKQPIRLAPIVRTTGSRLSLHRSIHFPSMQPFAFLCTAALIAVGAECAATANSKVLDYRHCPTPSCVFVTVTATVTVTTAVRSTDICTEAPPSSSSTIPTTSFTSTTSTTTSATATSTAAACSVPPACGNLGFDWAYYNSSARNTDKAYSSFHPTTFKRIKPLYVGTTPYVSGPYGQKTGQPGPIYGSSNKNFKLDYFALNHVAYLYACEQGTYRISIPYANDAVYLWTGRKAYAGWTEANADAKALYNQPDHVAGSAKFAVTIPADTYVPIRFVYGQAQYGGGFTFNVTTPSGQVIVGSDTQGSPYVVRYSCDQTIAPRFTAFGRES